MKRGIIGKRAKFHREKVVAYTWNQFEKMQPKNVHLSM